MQKETVFKTIVCKSKKKKPSIASQYATHQNCREACRSRIFSFFAQEIRCDRQNIPHSIVSTKDVDRLWERAWIEILNWPDPETSSYSLKT
jgi:hypothetical protein